MNYFGNKEVFSIVYELKPNPFRESGIMEVSWGTFQLWVSGKLITTFLKNDVEEGKKWVLYVNNGDFYTL